MSLLGFIEHVAGFSLRLAHEEHKALEHAAKIIQTEAKAEIGTYQDTAGPFAAWQELADSTKADRVHQGFSANDPLLRTGEMRESIEYTVGTHEAAIGSNSDIAVWQELGTQKIPARSFLGGAAMRKAPHVAEILGASAVQALVGPRVRIPISQD